MLPLSKNPPARFPERAIHDAKGPWCIAKVKPRQEKALALDFIKMDIEYYLPMYTKVTRRKDNNKPRKSVLCLFPGYISFSMHEVYDRDLYKTNRVVTLVKVKNQTEFKKQMEQIYTTYDLGIPMEPVINPSELPPGQAVQVVAGPMRGLNGTIIKIHSDHKLILSVDVLGMASVTINASFVEPVN